jgi:hypothetical protein
MPISGRTVTGKVVMDAGGIGAADSEAACDGATGGAESAGGAGTACSGAACGRAAGGSPRDSAGGARTAGGGCDGRDGRGRARYWRSAGSKVMLRPGAGCGGSRLFGGGRRKG